MEFTEILDEYHITYRTEGQYLTRAGWVQMDCPFCGKDTEKFHMGYHLEGRFLNCWQCGSHHLVPTLQEWTGLSYPKLKELIKHLPSIKTDIIKIKGKLKLPYGVGQLMKPHVRYLKSRGYDPAELEMLWKIQGIGLSTTHAWRIYIPIQYRNQTVSWTTRSIADDPKFRYMGAPVTDEAINKTDLLYGEDYCRHAIVICEGPFDAWRIGPGAVAVMGLSFSPSQIERMLKYPLRIVCLDNQRKAQERAKGLADMLSLYDGDTYNVQLDSKDAGSATKKEINKIRSMIR